MKRLTTLYGRMIRPGAARTQRGLLLILLLALLVAGCGPQTVVGSWAGLSPDANGLVMAYLDRVARLNEVGAARWEFPTPSERGQAQFYAPPAVTEDVVYVGSYNNKVYALDRDNGTPIWVNEDAQDRIIGGVAVAQGRVVVGLGDHGVMALNQRTGEQEWYFDTGHGVWSTPLIVGDTVIATSLDHYVYTIDIQTGEQIWRQDLEGAVAGSPTYRDGVLYVGSFAHKLFALAVEDGEILRSFETQNWVWGGPALSEDGVLYFGDLSGQFYALEAATFEPIWQQKIANGAIRATPLLANDLLIIGARDNHVYAVNRETGAPVWNQTTPAAVLSEPVLLEDGVVVVNTLSSEVMLIAYEVENGREVWRYPAAASDAQ